jgi:hypothetical protein
MNRILERAIVRDSRQLARPKEWLETEKWTTMKQIANRYPTRNLKTDFPRWERPSPKDKLISLVRKRNRKTGRTYYSKQQILANSIVSKTKPAQTWLKNLADNFNSRN